MAWSSAMCYAVQVAYDVATNDAYKDDDGTANDANPANNTNGWKPGDNGGTGFGAWDFNGTYNPSGPNPGAQQKMDDGLKSGSATSSPFNDIQRSWTIFRPPGDSISQAGRSIPTLQVGQTVSIVFDSPNENAFAAGFAVKFNNGGANGCYAGDNCTTPAYDPGSVATRMSVLVYGWIHPHTVGRWHLFTPDPDGWPPGANPPGHDPLMVDETDQGVKMDFTLTGPEAFTVVMDPFQAGVPTHMASGTLEPGEGGIDVGKTIDWIELEFYNTDSNPGYATDWYIRSMEITAPDPVGEPGDFNEDGKVDAADYVIWRKNTGNSALPNDNGLATQAERFSLWRSNFGNMAMPGGGAGGGSAIPEPGTFVYLVGAIAGLSLWRRR
jgi:hypothetical protein